MESKKHVFIDNDEARKDLIIGVLDKYCVPRKIITETESDMFGNHTNWYDIEINVNDKAWELINSKVKEVLTLENSFDLRCKPGVGEIKKNSTESKQEKNKKPTLGGLLSGLFSGLGTGLISTPEDIDAFLYNPDKEETTEPKEKINGIFDYKELPEYIQNQLIDHVPEAVLTSPNCKIQVTMTDTSTRIAVLYMK